MRPHPRITLSIHPFFWIFAALIGFLMSGSLMGSIMWIVIILVSVLVHEFGHAIMAVVFKQSPRIQLVALGGVTSYEGKNLKYWQQFLIALFGPLFGVLLFGFATLVLYLNIFHNPVVVGTFKILQVVNLFWSIVNLLPVLPLDGGQLLRIALEGFFGVKGFRLSLLLGCIIAGVLALGSFAIRYYLLGALFFLFAFQSFDMYRKSKHITKSDRDQKFADELQKAEALFAAGQKKEAEKLFEDLLGKTKNGLIFVAASHYLAFINNERKEYKKAYDLLVKVKDDLQDEAVPLLQKLAFEQKNFKLTSELSAEAYKLNPTKDVALMNARSFGFLNQPQLSGGWLKTASEFGSLDLEKIIQENYFDQVKNSDAFLKFFK
ncbi:MAG: hypothetical protein JXA94_05630 [Parachlamydiales bacterium]|nr:hypothetical protein [Parachlamydiales bacterium]